MLKSQILNFKGLVYWFIRPHEMNEILGSKLIPNILGPPIKIHLSVCETGSRDIGPTKKRKEKKKSHFLKIKDKVEKG
jgi:hypothetical protein